MLASEIATRVKRQFGDEADIQIKDEDILRWINDAQREIASANDLLQTVATTAVVANQREYTLPANILLLRSVHYQGQKLRPLNSREAEEYLATGVATGTPIYFWAWANKINLYPQPDSTDPDDLQLFYTRQPTEVTAVGDTPEIPLEYHNAIVQYCLAQAYELDENWSAAQTKSQQFNSGVANLKGKEEANDFYPHITSTDVEVGYGW